MERDWQLKDCGENLVELKLWWIERDCQRTAERDWQLKDCGEKLAELRLWWIERDRQREDCGVTD